MGVEFVWATSLVDDVPFEHGLEEYECRFFLGNGSRNKYMKGGFFR